MHVHFEKSINAETDCTILSLSWMGKVPDELPEDEGWKLNRNHYYQEGWLATGNIRGILGVTYTTSHWKRSNNPTDVPQRSNYNLRGHRSQVTLVQWNEPYQKLASCDSSGIIFVWIKFEGRWSIELINDRSTPVTHFSWSHDGRMALICYQDGFVLVGSVAGQRYWSTGLNLDGTITCGIWTPDDQQVYFGTSNGQIIVMDVHGTMLSQVQLPSDSPIAAMSWSCEKFKMEESEEGEPSHYLNQRHFVLAVTFTTGGIYIMKNYDDISPLYIFTGMHGLHMEWSNSGEFLAIAGSRPVETMNDVGVKVKEYSNHLHIYSPQGVRILNLTVPFTKSPVTALTWGHNDKRIFVATGQVIHVGWVSKRIASLQLLCRLTIYKSLSTETCVSHLPLPLPVRALISSLHTQTILSTLPSMKQLREFVCHPPPGTLRLHCTMIRHEEDTNQSPGTVYTLYVEYLGGLVPILKGKRTSKIRPEFVIFDPQASSSQPYGVFGEHGGGHRLTLRNSKNLTCTESAPEATSISSGSAASGVNSENNLESSSGNIGSGESRSNSVLGQSVATIPNPTPSTSSSAASSNVNGGYTDSSESDDVELCASPRMQRKRYRNRQRERERMLIREREREWERTRSSVHLMPEPTTPHQLVYGDVLPERVRLVEVTSNIWGTKFKIHGLHAPAVPENLGSVTYKTSLLHLQPRQMTLLITELRDDIFLSPDTAYSHVEDEEEDFSVIVGNDSIHHHQYSANGGGGEVFNGHHVIYHPQGAGTPIIPPNRCFLQPRSSSNAAANNRILSSTSVNSRSNSSPVSSGNGSCRPGPGIMGCGGNNTPQSNQSPFTSLGSNPPESYSDDEQEHSYVDLISNPDLVQFRERLRQAMRQECGMGNRTIPSVSGSATSTTGSSSILMPVQSQVSVPTSNEAMHPTGPSPIRRRSIEDSSSGGGMVGITSNTNIDAQDRLTNVQRVKNNMIIRAQVENVRDENVSQQSSFHRTSGSNRSPSRICWSTVPTQTEVSQNRPIGPEGRGEDPAGQPQANTVGGVPIHVRRSISASYLDTFNHQGTIALDIANNEAADSAPKRLVLVKSGRNSNLPTGLTPRPRLRDSGKSKSWDSDISWWRNNYTYESLKQYNITKPCSKCSFPSTSKLKQFPSSTLPPGTPAKNVLSTKNNKHICSASSQSGSGSSSSTSTTLPSNSSHCPTSSGSSSNNYNTIPIPTSRRVPQTPARQAHRARSASQSRNSSNAGQILEDQIEHAPPLPSAGGSNSNLNPIPNTPPPATPTTHRRSISLLTPLLRRRDLNSRQNQLQAQSSGDKSTPPPVTGGNPASSSYIPPGSPQHQPRSSPTTPAALRKHKSYFSSASSPLRQLFANSPLLRRRKNKNSQSNNAHQQQPLGNVIIDSSDEEGSGSHTDEPYGRHSAPIRPDNSYSPRTSMVSVGASFRDLETFQKQQLRQKLRKKKIHNTESSPFPRRREFLMHNKAPMWNENSQVYQLDFGGRVTQESAKNFQIEFRGKQVMQFGRIDGNAYTMDFQYPFSALQAFAVALANVTQRLK